MGFQVNAPLVVAKPAADSAAGYRHIYKGGMLPVDVDAEQLSQLLGAGMVVEIADTPVEADEEPTGDRPGPNASKAAWVAYAVAEGVDQDEAEASTRDELRKRFEQ